MVRWTDGNSGHEQYHVRITVDGGREFDVFIRHLNGEKAESRLRKELAAYQLNGMIGFDNGFPATSVRSFEHEGKTKFGAVQVDAGEPFDFFIRRMAHERFGDSSSDNVVKLIHEDANVRREVEQAFIERLVYGDTDNHADNFLGRHDRDGRLRIVNIDLDYGFSDLSFPFWQSLGTHGVNRKLHLEFSERPISAEIRGKLSEFIAKYDNPTGLVKLRELGLSAVEVDAMMSRTRWLAENGVFPKAFKPSELDHIQSEHLERELGRVPEPRSAFPVADNHDLAFSLRRGDSAEPLRGREEVAARYEAVRAREGVRVEDRLAANEPMQRFFAELQRATTGWPDSRVQIELANRTFEQQKAAYASYKTARNDAARKLAAELGIPLDKALEIIRGRVREEARSKQDRKSDAALAYIEMVKARNNNARAVAGINEVVAKRLDSIRPQLDALARELGLPPYLVMSKVMGSSPESYQVGIGAIRLSPEDFLVQARHGELIRNLYHESVHASQDVQVIRLASENVMSREGESGVVNPLDRLADISAEYQRLTGRGDNVNATTATREAHETLLRNTLSMPENLLPLSDGQRTRAEQLAKSFESLRTSDYERNVQHSQVIDSTLSKLAVSGDNAAVTTLLDQLAARNSGGRIREHLFGRAQRAALPAQLTEQIRAWKRARRAGAPETFDVTSARQLLEGLLRDRRVEMSAKQQSELDTYFNRLHEIEAQEVTHRTESVLPRTTGDALRLTVEAVRTQDGIARSVHTGNGDLAMWQPIARVPEYVVTGGAIGGEAIVVQPGHMRSVGRIHQRAAFQQNPNPNVSRNHAALLRNADGTYFIQDTGSTHGTYIRRAGEVEFRRITAVERITHFDEVMLGGLAAENLVPHSQREFADPANRQGTRLEITREELPALVRPLEPALEQPLIGDLQAGEFQFIGIDHQSALGDPASPTYNGNVSRDHASLNRDASGVYYLEDQGSMMGTFVRRQGEADFQQLIGREQVVPGDIVMLGGIARVNADVAMADYLHYPEYRKGTELVIGDAPPPVDAGQAPPPEAVASQRSIALEARLDALAPPRMPEIPMFQVNEPVVTIGDGRYFKPDLAVGAEVIIGRGKENITDEVMSRRHARLGRDEKGVFLQDLASTNGVRVVERPGAEPRKLVGDEKVYLNDVVSVRMGETVGLEGGFYPREELFVKVDGIPRRVELGDAAQRDLAFGTLQRVGRLKGGNSGLTMYTGFLTEGGRAVEVILRPTGSAKASTRTRKEVAVYH